MSKATDPTASKDSVADLLAAYDPAIRDLVGKARALVRQLVPDAVEEVDRKAKMTGYNFIPGTYKGLIMTISPQKNYVNLIFSKGVELKEIDPAGLLEGTGKLARHIKIRTPDQLDRPDVRVLIEAAAARTPRSKS